MTAESTVPSPGAQPWDHGFAPVSVLPARAAGGFRFPLRRPPARPASPLPLLAADLFAADAAVLRVVLELVGPDVLKVVVAD
ncbi:transferase, partial [Streptomyces sp. NPDC005890]